MNQNNEKDINCLSMYFNVYGRVDVLSEFGIMECGLSLEHNMQENGTRMGKLCLLYEYATG